MEPNTILNMDCLQGMDLMIEQGIKVDAIITDPPYGTTACKWDNVIPFDAMWERLKALRKDRTPIVLFGSEPFSSALRMSNIKEYKYDWVWNKKLAGNGILAKKQPLKIHELVHIFYIHNYFPMKTKGAMRKKMTTNLKISEINGGNGEKRCKETINNMYYPKSIIEFSMGGYRTGRLHPTQKSTALLEYLIKTYTNKDDCVLDFTMGSGTTAIACINTERKYYGFELDKGYFDIAQKRIKQAHDSKRQMKFE